SSKSTAAWLTRKLLLLWHRRSWLRPVFSSNFAPKSLNFHTNRRATADMSVDETFLSLFVVSFGAPPRANPTGAGAGEHRQRLAGNPARGSSEPEGQFGQSS